MARRSPVQLLRLRNKELRAAREAIARLSRTPTYTLSYLKEAAATASKAMLGDMVRVSLPFQFRAGTGRTLSAEDITLRDIHVLKDTNG